MSIGLNTALVLLTAVLGTQAWAQTSGPAGAPTSSSNPNTSPEAQQPPGSGQTTAPATPPSAPPVPDTTFSSTAIRAGGIDFSGSIDGYYSFNNNHPQSGFNELYNFNDRTNQWDLNLAKLTVSRDPAPIGFRVDVGFGRAFEIEKTPHPDPEFYRFIEQSYVSVKPKGWKGFEADFGEFVTSAGAEVIESKDNWNYSRSLLFAWAIPYYHFGLRTSMPIGSSLSVGFQLVNGWNSIVDQYGNNLKTAGITAAVTRKKFTWNHNYYVGPQFTGLSVLNQNINRVRNLYDTTLLLTPNDKVNAYLNFDYGRQNLALGSAHWIGFAGALHLQLTKRFAITPRAEYLNDVNGFATGVKQHLHEATVTGEWKIIDGLLSRLEYRHDASNINFFDHGTVPSASKAQSTVTLGFIAYLPAKHQ
ncbi:MAG: porin [Acidobacteriaceae bacterium]|nr:porin [Acidobacteriaceae bacterium]